jgi:hypothetical protein
MAVGDVVNGIGAASTRIDFQPAAGVEIMISYNSGSSVTVAGLTNGIVDSPSLNIASLPSVLTNTKMFINNTNYLYIEAAGQCRGYTGIQIK